MSSGKFMFIVYMFVFLYLYGPYLTNEQIKSIIRKRRGNCPDAIADPQRNPGFWIFA